MTTLRLKIVIKKMLNRLIETLIYSNWIIKFEISTTAYTIDRQSKDPGSNPVTVECASFVTEQFQINK